MDHLFYNDPIGVARYPVKDNAGVLRGLSMVGKIGRG